MESHFSFLSWNLALLNRSAYAPQHWELCDTEEVVREQVIELSPDIVLFQELPGLVPYVETHNMVHSNPQSHSGHLAILISERFSEFEITLTPLEGFGLLVTFMEVGLTVANVHLAPGKGNSELRLSQLAAVINSSPTEHIAIIGDTNTRASEITKIKDSGLKVPDLPVPTWDSFRNRFHVDSPRFKASFTRCITHPDVKIRDLQILEGKVIRSEKTFYISDHFALFGRMQL
tara:strand:+ start:1887 stop:2582 length:696 start_codon:yes stop_codon:yes gene_type:complete